MTRARDFADVIRYDLPVGAQTTAARDLVNGATPRAGGNLRTPTITN